MRRLEYRAPRKTAAFPIEFSTDSGTTQGSCRDVSETGIRAEFDCRSPLGATGVLTLRHPAHKLTLLARITHAEPSHVGFSFVFAVPEERGAAKRFVALVTEWTGAQGLRFR